MNNENIFHQAKLIVECMGKHKQKLQNFNYIRHIEIDINGISWNTPPHKWMLINVDGAFLSLTNKGSCGGMV